MRINSWVAALTVVGMLAPRLADAQTRSLEKPSEQVFVMHAGSGEELHGRLLDLGPETLSIVVDNRRVDLPLNDVLRIDRRGDSLKNGAIIGAVVFGGWCAFICGQGVVSGAQWASVAVLNGLLGAAIGASLDATHNGRTTVYRKTPESKSRSVGVAFRLRF